MLSKRLKNMTPYTPGEQPQNRKYVKLNTNENPYPPAPKVATLLEQFATDFHLLRLYPDPQSSKLRKAIAKYYRLDEKNVFVGNGSDEVLAMAFFAFFDSNEGKLLFPSESYSFYPVYCQFYGIDYHMVPLKEDFSIGIQDYLTEDPLCGMILTNPNAPTGIALSLNEIKNLLDQIDKNKVVVIDEAYIDFGGESAIPLIQEYKNLLIIQTFSKGRSLAGLRLGFALGDEKLIEALHTAKDSFNSYPADRIAQALGEAAIEDHAYFRSTTAKIIETRELFSAQLTHRGWKVLPSCANFIFAKHPTLPGKKLYEGLKERGVLVRWFNKPSIQDFLRITIGLPEEMEILLSAVDQLEAKRQ